MRPGYWWLIPWPYRHRYPNGMDFGFQSNPKWIVIWSRRIMMVHPHKGGVDWGVMITMMMMGIGMVLAS